MDEGEVIGSKRVIGLRTPTLFDLAEEPLNYIAGEIRAEADWLIVITRIGKAQAASGSELAISSSSSRSASIAICDGPLDGLFIKAKRN